MKFDDWVSIEMRDPQGQSIFGEIKQQVKPYRG